MEIDGWIKGSLGEVAADSLALEQMGFDGAFTFEGPHDPFLPVALASVHTTRLRLMTNIAVGFARSPMDLAQTANDLQQMSGGRFALGVGSQVRPHIVRRFSMEWGSPVRRMAELVGAVKAIQAAWQEGGGLHFRGEFYTHTLMTPFFDPGPNPYGPPPVYVAGLGPRMTETAAEVADGLLVHPFNSERFVREHTAAAVEAGLSRAGRRREGFTVVVTAIVATALTDEDMVAAVEGVRRLLSFYGSTPAYRVVLDAHGYGDLQTELNTLSKQGRWAEMVGLVDDEVLDTVAVRGAPEVAAAELVRRYAGVADRLSFSTPYPIARECTEALVSALRNRS
jgi:probable F420-dependent oxidoreductase